MALLAERVMLLLICAVLLLERSDPGGGGTFTGFETDLARREARIVAVSRRRPPAGGKVVFQRSRVAGRATSDSVPVVVQ